MAIEIKPFSGINDERLGKLEANGTGIIKQWPATDILGREYSTPSTTITLPGGKHFVVLPPGSNAVQLIEQVKAGYVSLTSTPASPAKSSPQTVPAVKPAEDGDGK